MNPEELLHRNHHNDLWGFPCISYGNWTHHDKPIRNKGTWKPSRVKASKPRRKMAKASRRVNRKEK